MGSAESAEARRVSFEMDEEERVRVLQGIRVLTSSSPSDFRAPFCQMVINLSFKGDSPGELHPCAMLSESVVNRMKDSCQPSAQQQPAPGPAPAPPAPAPSVRAPTAPAPTTPTSTTPVPSKLVPMAPPPSSHGPPEGTLKAPQTDPKVPRAESGGGQQPSSVKEDLKRFQQEQVAVQDELIKVAKKEKEAAEKHLKASLPKKRVSLNREQQQSARL
ncbi:hypothetical protein STEG23_017605, partial [Scotinomys teguina]